jgi:hypothetical protein
MGRGIDRVPIGRCVGLVVLTWGCSSSNLTVTFTP